MYLKNVVYRLRSLYFKIYILFETLPSSNDAFGTSELGLWKPKSAHSKRSLFDCHIRFIKAHDWFSKIFDLKIENELLISNYF